MWDDYRADMVERIWSYSDFDNELELYPKALIIFSHWDMEPILQLLALTTSEAIAIFLDWLRKWAEVLALILSLCTILWTSISTKKVKRMAKDAKSGADEAKTRAGEAESKASDAEIRASEAKLAAEAAKADLRKFSAIANFSSALSLIDDLIRLHRTEKWEIALERFNSLRAILNELQVVVDDTQKTHVQSCITLFNETESKVEKFQNKTSDKALNISLMNEVMKNQKDKLQIILAQLKTK